MAGDNNDSEHIDRLIRELTTEPRQPAKGVTAPPAASDPAASSSSERRPVHTWSTGRLPMPSLPATSAGSRTATFGSAISLPQLPHLPDLTRAFRLPGPVTLVRMWVGLAIAHSVSMTFWPYPKMYLWGLTLYLLSLSLAVVAGVWGARLSWDARLGAAHTVALVSVVWAVALAAAETLPLL